MCFQSIILPLFKRFGIQIFSVLYSNIGYLGHFCGDDEVRMMEVRCDAVRCDVVARIRRIELR